jgi:hypothetical protein
VDLAEEVLSLLVSRRVLAYGPKTGRDLEHVAQPLGGDAHVVQRLDLRGSAAGA